MNKEIKRWWNSLYTAAREDLCNTYNIKFDEIDDENIIKLYNRIALTNQMI